MSSSSSAPLHHIILSGALEIDLLITVAAFKQVHMRVVEPPSLDTDVEKGKAKADDAELLKPPAVMSTKIERMLAILEETRTTKPGEKTIIFSSFTQMVRILDGRWRRIGSMGWVYGWPLVMSLSCVSCLSSVNCELQLDLIESPLKSAGYKFVRVSTCMFLRLMPCDHACRRHHVHSADIFGQIRTV